jgi:hypothetical protein
VLVTSRDELTSLAVIEGAHRVQVDLFSSREARHLLAQRLTDRMVDAEPAAADEIIDGCARLPLALAIVAARAAANPGLRLDDLARELRQAQGGLAAFSGADPSADLRAILSWSHRTLSPDALGLFPLLAVHPGPDIEVAAAASLTAMPPGRARSALAELARANLISEHRAGRYAYHDLIRAYAAELAGGHDRVDRSPSGCTRAALTLVAGCPPP